MQCSRKSEQTARNVVKVVLAVVWLVACSMWFDFQVAITVGVGGAAVIFCCVMMFAIIAVTLDGVYKWLRGELSVCKRT